MNAKDLQTIQRVWVRMREDDFNSDILEEALRLSEGSARIGIAADDKGYVRIGAKVLHEEDLFPAELEVENFDVQTLNPVGDFKLGTLALKFSR